MTTIARAIAQGVTARANCIENDNHCWVSKHENRIDDLLQQLPSGSGIDYGTFLDYERSTQEKIVLYSSYHVMNDDGYYTGIIDYRVIITASLLSGIDINIVGNFSSNSDAYGVKDYLIDLYGDALLRGVL